MPKKSKKKESQSTATSQDVGPWIPMRTGVIIIAITSVAMAALVISQDWGYMPPLEAIGWGLFFGGLIWVIFFGMLAFNRWTRGK